MKRSWLLIVFIAYSLQSFGSSSSDSLANLVHLEKDENKKATLLLSLCDSYRTYPVDSLKAYSLEAIRISGTLQDKTKQASAAFYLGVYYYKVSKLDSVKAIITNIRETITSPHSFDENKLLHNATILLAGVNMKENRQKDAMSLYYEVLSKAASLKDSANYLLAINGIGWATMELYRFQDAINWFLKGISTPTSFYFERYKTNMYSNIASCYGSLHNINTAKRYAIIALSISEKHDDLFCQANSLNILGNIYILEKNTAKAIQCLTRATEVRKLSGDPFFMVSDMSQLALLYASNKEFRKAIELSQRAIEIAENKRMDAKLSFLYNNLSDIYSQQGDFRNAYLTIQKLTLIKDKQYENASTEKIAELQVKYETSVKENTIQKQRFELSKKNYMLYGSIGLLLLAAGIGIAGYRNFTQKQSLRLQTELAKQREESARAILEMEEKERTRFAAELHDGLGPMLSAIKYNLSGISYKFDSFNADEKSVLDKTMKILDESCKEVRQVSHNIMPNALLKNGLANAIREFVSKIDNKNLQVDLNLSNIEKGLDPKIEIATYRIIQESVNNAIKHAEATKLDISITKDEEGLSGSIEDNGKGFDIRQATEKGIGLNNIISRVQFLHGHIEIDSRPGNGTLIAFHIP